MNLLLLFLTLNLAALNTDFDASLSRHRAQSGLEMPKRSARLDAAAESYARELATWGRLSHRSRNGQGPAHRASVLGLGQAGEVLGFGPDAEKVFEAWLNSPGHRRVLDDRRWTLYGRGTAVWGDGFVTVMLFWAP